MYFITKVYISRKIRYYSMQTDVYARITEQRCYILCICAYARARARANAS